MTKTKTKTKKNIKKVSNDSIKTLKEKIIILESDIIKGSKEINRITEKNIRLLAEFDNYKRRTQKERINLLKYDGEGLARALLPILDDLHRTLETDGSTKSDTIIKGIELITSKLDKTLIDLGIQVFDSIGDDFDPDRHEALMSEVSDKGENVIIREFEKGYMYNDKILRHAKVIVSKTNE
jgi:molecular chaperone GrpE